MARFYKEAFCDADDYAVEVGQSSLIGRFKCPHCGGSFAQMGRFVDPANALVSFCTYECAMASCIKNPEAAVRIQNKARRKVMAAPPRSKAYGRRSEWLPYCRNANVLSADEMQTCEDVESIVLNKTIIK